MDKDRAIITQVCAKIASDLTAKELNVDQRLSEFAVLFSSITDIMMEEIYGDNSKIIEQNKNVVAMVKDAFKGSEEIETSSISMESSPTSVTVKGKQHGPLPDWLIKACKRDGVTTVYDNRDSLALNPKRPSFKAVDAEKAYWPPRSR
jgi:hypothetical protein